jgi:hypothetical protein
MRQDERGYRLAFAGLSDNRPQRIVWSQGEALEGREDSNLPAIPTIERVVGSPRSRPSRWRRSGARPGSGRPLVAAAR